MKSKIILFFAIAMMTVAGCKDGKPAVETVTAQAEQPEGDKTIYGMVCDGTNDTIVIFLPTSFKGEYDGSDPDTLNILEASHKHHVFGQLRIGDKVAMMRNECDSTVADLVVVTQDLLGSWCYKVLPALKMRADMEGLSEEEQLALLPDSIAGLLSVEREYGMSIKINNEMRSVGMRYVSTEEEKLYIEYPPMTRYLSWQIYNGQLLLEKAGVDSLGNRVGVGCDTAALVKLTPDTLVLRFKNEERGYYRK